MMKWDIDVDVDIDAMKYNLYVHIYIYFNYVHIYIYVYFINYVHIYVHVYFAIKSLPSAPHAACARCDPQTPIAPPSHLHPAAATLSARAERRRYRRSCAA
jgi:hypothetical protein